jgi:hypothetical protein
MRGVTLGCLAAIVPAAGACGGSHHATPVTAPFVARAGVSSGPGSGLWGDGSSGPSGMRIGCIRGRRFAVLITIHNRSERTIMLIGAGRRGFAGVIERVAVQVRLAPPPPKGDIAVTGLRSWSGRNSTPATIPARRDAWVQSNFLMRNCVRLRAHRPLTVNRSITLLYREGSAGGTQTVSVGGARIILTPGPLHPRLPINRVG